jgi:protoporphyrinogen oxidase
MGNKKIVVIGAGMSGLGAAWRLSELGVSVEVFEAEERPGGMAATHVSDGFRFDFGIHGFFASRPGTEAVLSRIKALLKDELIEVTKATSIYFRKRYVAYPVQAKDLFLALSPGLALWCFLDFFRTRVKRRLGVRQPEASFEQWITARFGRALYNIYFKPYAQKVWGVDPGELSAEWLVRRVTTVSLWDVIRKALRQIAGLGAERRHEYSQQPLRFLYCRRGAGAPAQVIADLVEKAGGKIHLRSRVVEMLRSGNQVTGLVIEDAAGQRQQSCDAVISTIPVQALIKMLSPPIDENITAAAAQLRSRNLIFVFLKLNKPRVFHEQWVYYPDPATPFNRVNEFTNICADFAPLGKTGLCLELACFSEDEIWHAPDKAIFARCAEAMEKLGLVETSEVIGYDVIRMSYVYPIFTVQTAPLLQRVIEHVKTYKNLVTIGRQGLFQYINMDEALEQGAQAAMQMTERLGLARLDRVH